MIVPHDQLQPDTLRALIEEFITRNGAVQGHEDVPMDRMIQQVMAQLKSGKVIILFDEEDESCTIVPRDTLRPQ
ncbi:MAG TPA: YheU family protein [Tepidisphaeraceae bacterium]|nr:YheU family protein [Tepidisphaeraceae bacterium]